MTPENRAGKAEELGMEWVERRQGPKLLLILGSRSQDLTQYK